ncbi:MULTISPECIES: hypothetical protein [unclassified Rhodococcus (in: high G+C Gram-positive bacteria)]|uniref:hypothetical protein n=1 Tax=unclassified Rhodococcus (in: high G+C Gram-positive bacteria) TaxID=192944 RepID=UPI00233F50E9|nr:MULTISPECIES: hypothetical protein [unclassified Rhodococcus (in: high G+C Gram-positive bacteria)]MDC3724720.1 hypothetical protein [Rhodococcus sp. Rp3]WSE22861.1 hypothetical protein U9J23_00595 [Rhodococcus sp. PD04]
MKRTQRAVAATVPLALALSLAACSSDDDSSSTAAGEVSYPTVPYTTPGEGISLGHDDQEIGDTIPEPVHVSEIQPASENDLLAVLRTPGGLEIGVNVLDPVTGVAGSRIVVGPGIWDPVIHGFVGESSSDPAVLAAEVWRPRGSRGQADFTVTTYSGDLLEPDEIELPDYARAHSRPGSSAVTSDGKYFVTWDDGLYGVRVVDLEAGKESGALQIIGCGPFTWLDGHELYSVCEDTRELIQISIDDAGVPTETARTKVLPDDFVSNRKVTWAADAKKALLVGATGDVFVFDFSNGLPEDPVAPIGNAGQDGGRFAENAINNTGDRIAIEYTDSEIHPHSARGGDIVKVELFDAAGLTPIRTLDLEALGLTDIASMAFSVDGSILYVVGSGPEVDGESAQRIVGVSASDGAEVSAAEVTGTVDDIRSLLTPQVIR